jgi:TP901 family phage tail tape measure protein
MAKAIPLPVVQTGFEQSIEAGKKAVGTINIPVNIDPSPFKNLNQPLGKITGLATEFEKSIAASNARVLAFGASVGILNAISKGFKSILDNGIAVEKALGDIGAVSGQSAAQLDQLGDALFNVAKNTSQSFNTAAKAALEFSRQGLSVEETVKRTNDALTLTRFTSLSAADAVDTLTAAVNSFSGAGLTTTQILNKLIAVDSAFAVSAEDLANGLARAGSIAQEVGVSFDELNGLITVAQEKTARGGAVIGNALKTIFTRVRSDETISALRAVGVESLDTAGNLRDVVPILTDLSLKLKDLSGGERIQILEAVASKYNINILSALLGDIGNAESQFKKALGTGLGATNEATARQVELNKLLDVALNQAAVSAGELANNLAKIGINDNLKSLVGYVNSFLDSINKLLSSDDTGGDLARGIVKGFSDVLFKVGLPLITAIFIKLTKDIATFGIESLQTILGINQKVKERQTLEQAVTNTLISNKGIMDQILAASGNQVKQQEILLKAYGDQIAALKTIQSISASVAPALQSAGLVVTPNGVGKKDGGKGKAAEGYLPAQEAADIRRGVGGASSSSKVVSIPNFAFGGGKKGTMIANTSEYVVPNFANGGSAIFNQDMVKAYGLPAGAKKIGAANGYIPNFAKYIYDSDRIPADKNATLKAILASSAKKNLLIAPAGAGKSTLAAGMGTFLTGAADVANATEIDILSGAGRTKDGGLSKNLESIMAAVNASGGKVSYLYTKNLDILSRRAGRTDPSEGDLRSKKQIAGTAYAPLNQFDFMGMVKSKANSFSMVRGAGGYIPNFADVNEPERFAALIGKKTGRSDGFLNRYSRYVYKDPQGKVEVDNATKLSSLDKQDEKLIQFNTYGIPSKSDSQLTDVKQQLSEYGKNSAVQLAKNMTSQKLPSDFIQGKLAATFNPGSLASFAGTIFEASVGALLGDKSFQDYSEQAVTSAFDLDIRGNDAIKTDFKIPQDVQYLEVKGSDSPPLIKSIAKKIYQVTELNRAATSKTKIGAGKGVPQPIYDLNNLTVVEGVDQKTRTFKTQKDLENYLVSNYTKTYHVAALNSPSIDKGLWPTLGPRTKKGAAGYIPNFAQGGPLEDAIQREMAAGLDPSQIRVTTDGKLKSPSNPNGFAVINTRDEPNGKIPNFAKNENKIRKQILGKGTAEGPLLPRGYQIPENGGGYTFDYGVGSAQTAQSTAVNSAEQDSINKSLLTTNKLMLAFSGLSIATSTLQSTFKDTDSVIAKSITTLSQVATTAAGYGGIGSLAGETFKGKLGKAAGYMGPAGAVIGAGIGIFSAAQDEAESRRAVRIKAAESKIQTITESSKTPKEAQDTFVDQYIEKSEKYQRLAAEADTMSLDKGTFDAGRQFEIATERKQIEADLEVLVKSISDTQSRINDLVKQEAGERKKIVDDLNTRLIVQKAIFEFEDALNIKANKNLVDRTRARAKLIENSRSQNESQKTEAEFDQRINEFAQQRADLEDQALKDTFAKVKANSALATIDEKAFNALVQKVKAQEDLGSLEEEFKGLKTDGALILQQYLKELGEQLKRQKDTNQAQEDSFKISQRQVIETEKLIKADQIRLSAIQDRVAAERKLADIQRTGQRAEEDLTLQTKLISLQNRISTKPFATRQDQKELAELNAQIAETTELRAIDRSYENAITQSETDRVEAYKKSADALNFLTLQEKERLDNLIAAKNFKLANDFVKSRVLSDESQGEAQSRAAKLIADADANSTKEIEIQNRLREIALAQLKNYRDYEYEIAALREKSPAQAGAVRAMTDINKEAYNFTETFSYNTTLGFRDGLRDALGAAVSGTDDLRGALQGVAQGFLKTMQQAFLQQASDNVMIGLSKALPSVFPTLKTAAKGGYVQKFASGGFVTGGSGVRDDVPAMLSSGEYVMRKSAVQKYGAENIAKMNNGGIFLPGVRGGSEISGYDQLSKFANQTTTSGATDILRGTGSTAFANLEDQSVRLSRFGLMNEDTIKGEITSAQQQGLELIAQREAYRTQQRKAMQQQIVGTALSLAINAGTGFLNKPKIDVSKGINLSKTGYDFGKSVITNPEALVAYGGMIRGFNNGGGPTDDIPALLMGGEYVMDRATVRKYGKQYLDSMNSGRAKFAEGGYAGAEAETTTESTDSKAKVDAKTGTAVNISINVSGGNASTESQGQTSQGGVDYKKMSERIKAVVLETLNEEKRLGGSLRTR